MVTTEKIESKFVLKFIEVPFCVVRGSLQIVVLYSILYYNKTILTMIRGDNIEVYISHLVPCIWSFIMEYWNDDV